MHARTLLPFLWGADQQPATRAEDQAQDDSDSSYRRMSDLVLVGVYSCDSLGVIQYYNNRAAEFWGRRPAVGDTDVRFSGACKLYRPDGTHMPHDRSLMADVLSGKISGVYDTEVHIERPDGSRVVVIMNIAPMIDDDGAIVGAINSFYDINDRKDAKP